MPQTKSCCKVFVPALMFSKSTPRNEALEALEFGANSPKASVVARFPLRNISELLTATEHSLEQLMNLAPRHLSKCELLALKNSVPLLEIESDPDVDGEQPVAPGSPPA